MPGFDSPTAMYASIYNKMLATTAAFQKGSMREKDLTRKKITLKLMRVNATMKMGSM